MTTRICPICGIEFQIEGNARNRKYCSVKCLRRSGITQKKLKGISARSGNYNDRIRLARYYGLKCRICGWSLPQKTIYDNGIISKMGGCEMHHITPVSEGGGDGRENLILLCPNHHKEADYGIITRDELSSLVISQDEIEKHELEMLNSIGKLLDSAFL